MHRSNVHPGMSACGCTPSALMRPPSGGC